QIDAAARTVALVAEQHVGWAGRRAEAAMHAGAQDPVRLRDLRIGQLREGERGLHPYPMRPGLRMLRGSNAAFTARIISSGTDNPAGGVRGGCARPRVPMPEAGAASAGAAPARPASHPAPPPQSR